MDNKYSRQFPFIPGRNLSRSYKKNCFRILIMLIVGFLFSDSLYSQCNTGEFLHKCSVNLKEYNYIQSFEARIGKMEKSEYYYVFSKGSEYVIIVCEEGQSKGNITISLYDRERNLIATTYKEDGNSYSELKFICSATGLYFIKIKFTSSKSKCGMCILGVDK